MYERKLPNNIQGYNKSLSGAKYFLSSMADINK